MKTKKRRIFPGNKRILSRALFLVTLGILCTLLVGTSQVAFGAIGNLPRIHSMVPAYGYPGQEVEFVIGGLHLPAGEVVTLSSAEGSHLVAVNCVVTDRHSICGQLCIGEETSQGWYSLTVQVPSTGTAIGDVQFQVEATPNPTLTSVEPETVKQGEHCRLSIGGTGFPVGSKATISFSGSGISPVSANVDEWNMIVADVAVSDDADLGSRAVTVSFPAAQVTAAPLEEALQVRQGDWADLKLVGVAAAAWFGGIVSGVVGFLDSEKRRQTGVRLKSAWSWRKFARTFIVSAIAGIAFAVGFQQFDSLQVAHYFVAFLGGAGFDALANRFLGATELRSA